MRTKEQVNEARDKVCDLLEKIRAKLTNYSQISDDEVDESVTRQVLLTGMSVALQWVAEQGGYTLQDIMDGKEVTI